MNGSDEAPPTARSPASTSPLPFELRRLGVIMEPEAGNPYEVEGVLNPAAVRGPDGELYLFPRLVARGNYSRIGIVRVRFNADGDPVGDATITMAMDRSRTAALYDGTGEGRSWPILTGERGHYELARRT